ncbi:envelope glycoprotein G [Equid alphaherpesvirus 3]|uniref:Envelope glycoprotein G n=2 Tax=Equid alphaherpesvirus 3 TaxID=80341 RepID=A0A077BCP3_9ALPH|nr:envelope glycoprotein G [Equid alphaherpesvirus 3]AIL02988.1 envelope glycoprotein G [Equid alphaherpesvirus 3]
MKGAGAVVCVLSLLAVANCRRAPAKLCYADPRDGPEPWPLLPGPMDNVTEPTVNATERSKGCELRLLEPRVNAAKRPPERVNATIAWYYDLGICRAPVVLREYYLCEGDKMPSPDTCEGYSYTVARTEGFVEFVLVNASLMLQPGIYDSGDFIYNLRFGPDLYSGRIALRVSRNLDYPCKMTHGITARDHLRDHYNITRSQNSAHKRATGCFPAIVETEAWTNVSLGSLGLPNDYDESDFTDDDAEFTYDNIYDCREYNLFEPKRSLGLARGPQSLLIGALGLRILSQRWYMLPGETYDQLRQNSRGSARGADRESAADVTEPEEKPSEKTPASPTDDEEKEEEENGDNEPTPAPPAPGCDEQDAPADGDGSPWYTGGILVSGPECGQQKGTNYAGIGFLILGVCLLIGLIVYVCVLRSRVAERKLHNSYSRFSRRHNTQYRRLDSPA